MERLSEFELELLEVFPVEPTGLSLAELTEGLPDDRGPATKSKVRRALESVSKALGGLHVRKGNDDLGGFGVKMYGAPRREMPAVRRFFAAQMAMA